MTTIRIDLIRPSPHPVRTSWDEDRLNELAASIAEQGVIVPVKVRLINGLGDCAYHGVDILTSDWDSPGNQAVGACGLFDCMACAALSEQVRPPDHWPECPCVTDSAPDDACTCPGDEDEDGYGPVRIVPFEIVYGHRRIEAARRAGLTEVPAIVEGVDDDTAHVEAGIENLVREGMAPLDIAEWCAEEKRKGKTNAQVGAMVGKSYKWVERHLALLGDDPGVQEVTRQNPGSVSEHHARAVRNAGLRGEDAAAVLRKAVTDPEPLGWRATERVAAAVAAASPEQREAILAEPFGGPRSTFLHDPEWVKERRESVGDHRAAVTLEDKKADPPQATVAFKWAKAICSGHDDIEDSIEAGKLAPEHVRKLADMVRNRAALLVAWADRMEETYGQAG